MYVEGDGDFIKFNFSWITVWKWREESAELPPEVMKMEGFSFVARDKTQLYFTSSSEIMARLSGLMIQFRDTWHIVDVGSSTPSVKLGSLTEKSHYKR